MFVYFLQTKCLKILLNIHIQRSECFLISDVLENSDKYPCYKETEVLEIRALIRLFCICGAL